MKCLIITVALMNVALAPYGPWQARGWRGIIPLLSTRTDVEKILGPPVKNNPNVYETENEFVSVVYSGGPCEEGREGAWNVSANIVIRLEVESKKTLRVSDLHLDEAKYKKVENLHMLGRLSYIDDAAGVIIKTSYEIVEAVIYGPAAKDKHLSCSREPLNN